MHSEMILILVIAISGLIISTSSCNVKENRFNHISVLYDITDEHIVKPEGESILNVSGSNGMKWCGIDFLFSTISDVEYGAVDRIILEPANEYFSNAMVRKKQLSKFKEELNAAISKQEVDGKRYSIIYPVIVREANRLAQQSSVQSKHLIVYSDLMENSPGFSLASYRVSSGTSESDKLMHKLQSQYGVTLADSLEGLQVHFIYTASDYKDSKRFSAIASMYKRFFQERGATVNISANL